MGLLEAPTGTFEETSGHVLDKVRAGVAVATVLAGTSFVYVDVDMSTGGSFPAEVSDWSRLMATNPVIFAEVPVEPASSSEQLTHIRAALGLNISQLAEVLSVGRPTLYSWMDASAEPKIENQKRLDWLQAIADRAESVEFVPSSRRWTNSVTGGETPLERLSAIEEGDIGAVNSLLDSLIASSGPAVRSTQIAYRPTAIDTLAPQQFED